MNETRRDFVRDIIRRDLAEGAVETLVTRFPPEPNGYLHIGHAKSICLNFGVAEEFCGRCNLRFDDTNPEKEDQEYIDAIERDVRWLGFSWGGEPHFASDYFDQLYAWAQHLIRQELAYVDDQSAEEIRLSRGTLTEPGTESPYRSRTVDENLMLFEQMRDGAFEAGSKVLRAMIDMSSGNINLRDPVLYRIRFARHPRTGERWCIYPSYDFAHGQSDAIEGVTHSICTLEFEDHRPLYDWLIEHLPTNSRPRQYEFARLNLSHTILSKRRLIQLVQEGHVAGWDDPRMPTLAGLRRRGVPAAAIRDFCGRIGVAKADSQVELALLEHCVREELNRSALRRMVVLDPIKLIIDGYHDDAEEKFEVPNNPEDVGAGTRLTPFSKEIWIERADFMEDAPRKFFRLSPGREVRLRAAYLITCIDIVKDESGQISEIRCSYDPASRGGSAPDGRRVKGTLHWISAKHAVPIKVRHYEPLLLSMDPSKDEDFLADLSPDSLQVNQNALAETAIADVSIGQTIQFERQGYYAKDTDSDGARPVFNRTVGLRDTWGKIASKS